MCTKEGKGQDKCVLINSAGGGGIQGKNGKKCPYSRQTKYFTELEGVPILQRGKNHKMAITYCICREAVRVVDKC